MEPSFLTIEIVGEEQPYKDALKRNRWRAASAANSPEPPKRQALAISAKGRQDILSQIALSVFYHFQDDCPG